MPATSFIPVHVSDADIFTWDYQQRVWTIYLNASNFHTCPHQWCRHLHRRSPTEGLDNFSECQQLLLYLSTLVMRTFLLEVTNKFWTLNLNAGSFYKSPVSISDTDTLYVRLPTSVKNLHEWQRLLLTFLYVCALLNGNLVVLYLIFIYWCVDKVCARGGEKLVFMFWAAFFFFPDKRLF